MQQSIQQLIDQHLKARHEERLNRERSGKFNCSSLGRCVQYILWDRMNVPKTPPDARTLRIFKAGDLFHEFVQGIIIKEYPEAQIEVTHQTDDVICRADIITEEEVISLKSQHSNAFWHMRKQLEAGASFKKIKFPHYIQASVECVYNNKKWARLVYISKDDLCIDEYLFANNAQMQIDVKQEISMLQHRWEHKDTVNKALASPRAFGYNKKTGKPNECYRYCPYKDKCFDLHGEPETQGGQT